jgi:hypothetical protein
MLEWLVVKGVCCSADANDSMHPDAAWISTIRWKYGLEFYWKRD